MARDDRVYLRHILDAITQIREYLHKVSAERFYSLPLLQDGVVRRLEIIGEASRNLSVELRNHYPNVPWGQIIGMRNRITHAYFDISLEIVWEIAQQDLPALERKVEQILRDIEESPLSPQDIDA